ncbi:hypothetical protein [Planomicrobium sp. CPCC 101110]|uniref:hypothetical protein n=1 Tax=Planomicrobium sp. CPCC 101110 TaxID=2599619 RepID=UPI0011B6678D|nr:hypothetical protein [Planomicrobium sp. CPCC 101110]TWT26274.1 hypothetical protein FQV30_10855 [Planomicrobium sp. CPCC 101110]
MIRLLILLMITGAVLLLAVFQFKTISMVKKMAAAGGAIAASFIGVLMQSGLPWYLPVLAIVAVSLAASLVFMKIVEKEESENLRLAEERKAKRQTSIPAAATEREMKAEVEAEEALSIKAPETIQVRNATKEPEAAKEREIIQEPAAVKVRETIPVREAPKKPEHEIEFETVPAKPAEMQFIQIVGKER